MPRLTPEQKAAPIQEKKSVATRKGMAKAVKRGTLDIKKHFADISAYYQESTQTGKGNFLLVGGIGAGKTHALPTAPGPILIDSFDPGGCRTIRVEIEKGRVFVDSQYEKEDGREPFAYKKWEENFNNRLASGIFDQIGTYCIDSGTNWLDAMMNEILRQNKRAGTTPQLQDYGTQQIYTTTYLKLVAAIPCNFIMTAHIDTFRDEVDGKVHTSLLAAGKNKVKIPLLFDEVYVMERKAIRNQQGTETGSKRVFLTEQTGKHQARTRLGTGGLFKPEEEPNIAALLKKAGLPWEDKESVL